MARYLSPEGHLEIICGPMFSGKSEELIRRLKRIKIAQKNVVVFKPAIDHRRGTEYVTSHDGSKIAAIPIDSPLEILDKIPKDTDVIGIDEAQFFSHELIDAILKLTDDKKYVIVAGLNLDFRAVPFGPMPTLLALADTVTKLSAICIRCGKEAFFTQRLVNGRPAKYNDPLVQIGAEDSYQARCRNCYSIDRKSVWQSSL